MEISMRCIVYKEEWLFPLLESLHLPYIFFSDEEELLQNVMAYDVVFIQGRMELVKKINQKEKINIICLSIGTEDCYQALQERVSGYLIMPIKQEDIQKEMEHLRYGELRKPFVRCFGRFEVYVNEKAIPFPRKKAKEILAYLVMKRGELVSVDEIALLLFGEVNEKRRNYVYVSKFELIKILKEHGLSNLFEVSEKCFRVNKDAFDCDYYQFLDGDTSLYKNEFMKQFSWGKTLLEEMRK